MDERTIEIRLAMPKDCAAVAGVLRAAFEEYRPRYTPAAFAATTPGTDELLTRWAEGPTWVAVRRAEAVGTIGAVPTESGVYVRSMAVLPAAAGTGVGRRLLEAVAEFARAKERERLYLSTTPFLLRAIRVYERFGFVRTEQGPHDLFGTPLFTMVKPLR